MKKNWRILVGAGAILLAVLVAFNPFDLSKAAEGDHMAYLPFVEWDNGYRFDDFEDLIPEWVMGATKEAKDGFFEHFGGKYLAHIRDNAAQMVSTPMWRTQGDFKLGSNGRFMSEWTLEKRLKSYNSWGLAFGANEDFSRYYALLLGDGGAQHVYALVYVKDTKFDTIYGWRGAPGFVKNWSSKNRLEVIRQGDLIQIWCNDRILPGGEDLRDSRLGDGYVGLMVTSYEFSDGEMQFDEFELTPLTD